MSGSHGPALVLKKCAHGRTQWERCIECDQERDARHEEERARVQGPAWLIEQAIKKRKRWFDGCAFCPPLPDLVQWTIHQHDCPFVVAMGESKIAYGLYLVERFDPGSTHPLPRGRDAKDLR